MIDTKKVIQLTLEQYIDVAVDSYVTGYQDACDVLFGTARSLNREELKQKFMARYNQVIADRKKTEGEE